MPDPKPQTNNGKGGHRPARGYSWKQFEEGHTLTLKHGANSPRSIAAELAHLDPQLQAQIAEVDYLRDPSYAQAIQAWARAEARCQLLERWFDERGLLDDDGKPRPGVDTLIRLEASAAKLRARLGLDPVSRASLTKSLTGAAADTSLVALLAAASKGGQPVTTRGFAIRGDAALARAIAR